MRRLMKSPARGAATSIHLASATELEKATGTYFVNAAPRRSADRGYVRDIAARLWQRSTELVS